MSDEEVGGGKVEVEDVEGCFEGGVEGERSDLGADGGGAQLGRGKEWWWK